MSAAATRNEFLVNAHRIAQMSDNEADEMADFFEGVGSVMMAQLMPILNAYRARIVDRIHNDVVDDIANDFILNSNGMVYTRNSVLARIKSHRIPLKK